MVLSLLVSIFLLVVIFVAPLVATVLYGRGKREPARGFEVVIAPGEASADEEFK